MKFIYATYNQYCNSIDITTFDNMILRIDCNKAEDGLKTTPNSQCALNALAIDNPMEYSRLALDNEMQAWVDAEDSLDELRMDMWQNYPYGSLVQEIIKSEFAELQRKDTYYGMKINSICYLGNNRRIIYCNGHL